MPRNPVAKPKAIRFKNIKKKTSDKEQAKQIATLSREITRINKEQTERIRTVWQMDRKSVGLLNTLTPTVFLCPVPYALCDPLGTSPLTGEGLFGDNNMPISTSPTGQISYKKSLVFGYSDAAANSNKIYHTGGKLRYQIITTEPSYTKLTMFLVKPKHKQADQLVVDRQLKGATAATIAPPAAVGKAGSSAFMIKDVDYTTYTPPSVAGIPTSTDTIFGSEINRKYWDIIYKREIALTHPGATGFANNTNPANTNPKNNALVASGTIKIPAAGVIVNKSQATQTVGNKSTSAMENSLLDQRNEQNYTLVIIHNDGAADLESVQLSLIVNDYYRAVV